MGIGGMVYSTISVGASVLKKYPKPYAIESGTSMATPYVAGSVSFLKNKCIIVISIRLFSKNSRLISFKYW